MAIFLLFYTTERKEKGFCHWDIVKLMNNGGLENE